VPSTRRDVWISERQGALKPSAARNPRGCPQRGGGWVLDFVWHPAPLHPPHRRVPMPSRNRRWHPCQADGGRGATAGPTGCLSTSSSMVRRLAPGRAPPVASCVSGRSGLNLARRQSSGRWWQCSGRRSSLSLN